MLLITSAVNIIIIIHLEIGKHRSCNCLIDPAIASDYYDFCWSVGMKDPCRYSVYSGLDLFTLQYFYLVVEEYNTHLNEGQA